MRPLQDVRVCVCSRGSVVCDLRLSVSVSTRMRRSSAVSTTLCWTTAVESSSSCPTSSWWPEIPRWICSTALWEKHSACSWYSHALIAWYLHMSSVSVMQFRNKNYNIILLNIVPLSFWCLLSVCRRICPRTCPTVTTVLRCFSAFTSFCASEPSQPRGTSPRSTSQSLCHRKRTQPVERTLVRSYSV